MKHLKNMMKLKSALLLIIIITLPLNFVNAQNSSESLVYQTENVNNKPLDVREGDKERQDELAILRDALKQALAKLSDLNNQIKFADKAIEALKKERALAVKQIQANESERAAMQLVIDKAEASILALQNEKAELKKESAIQERRASNLEKQIASEKGKTKFWKFVAVIGTVGGIVLGVFVANKTNE